MSSKEKIFVNISNIPGREKEGGEKRGKERERREGGREGEREERRGEERRGEEREEKRGEEEKDRVPPSPSLSSHTHAVVPQHCKNLSEGHLPELLHYLSRHQTFIFSSLVRN